MSSDSAEAYEEHAREFLSIREGTAIGADVVENWTRSLDPGIEVLEIACGGGIPVTRTLVESGLKVRAIDSSQTLVAEFRARFPGITVQCARIQESNYFDRKFGAVICIGLIFLLDERDQMALIRRVSQHLLPGGRFLFTAPLESCTWTDSITGHECISLGRENYETALRGSGFELVTTYTDDGENNYYEAELTAGPAPP